MSVRSCATELVKRVSRARVLDSAASAAFWLFFSLLPLAAVSLMIATKVASGNARIFGAMLGSVPATSRAFVGRELGRVAAWHGGTVGPVSAAVFVFLASSGVHALLDAFDATLDARRSWWKKRALAIAICVGLSLAIGIVALVVGRVGATALAWAPVRYGTAFACEVALIGGLFGVGMPRDVPRRRWPGAALAALLQVLLGWGYFALFAKLGSSSAYSATTLATIGGTMMALYLLSVSLLVGVAFNGALPERRQRSAVTARGREKTEPATHLPIASR